MYTLILILHFVACFLLIVAVLMQSGKGNAMGVFGGGGGSDAVFGGASGTTFIKKFTLALALIIACTSVGLTFASGRRGMTSVMERYGRMEAPAQPAAQAPADQKAAAPAAQQPVQKVAIPEKKAK